MLVKNIFLHKIFCLYNINFLHIFKIFFIVVTSLRKCSTEERTKIVRDCYINKYLIVTTQTLFKTYYNVTQASSRHALLSVVNHFKELNKTI